MQARPNSFLVLLCSVLLFAGCRQQPKELDPGSYLAYVNNPESGFIKEKNFNNVGFTLKHEPKQYRLAKFISETPQMNDEEFNKYKEKIGDLKYFILEMENLRSETDLLAEEITSQDEYIKRVNYYSYEFQNDIVMTVQGDTFPCIMFHYENSYGGTPVLKFLLAFDAKGKGNVNTVSINEKIFGLGTVNFSFDKKELTDLPELNYQ